MPLPSWSLSFSSLLSLLSSSCALSISYSSYFRVILYYIHVQMYVYMYVCMFLSLPKCILVRVLYTERLPAEADRSAALITSKCDPAQKSSILTCTAAWLRVVRTMGKLALLWLSRVDTLGVDVCSFFFFFWCGPFFLKSLLNLLQYCFYFMFWPFGPKSCGTLAPWPGIEPAPPALEGKVLTTGPPGKSLNVCSYDWAWAAKMLLSVGLGDTSRWNVLRGLFMSTQNNPPKESHIITAWHIEGRPEVLCSVGH